MEHGVIAVWQTADKGVGIGDIGGSFYIFHRGVQPSIPDVVGDGSGKQVGVLDDQGEGFSQIVLFDASDVDAVIGDGAAGNLVEPVNQIDNGGLSGAGGADEGDFLSWFRVEADIVQYLLLRGIAKDHMVEPHIAF